MTLLSPLGLLAGLLAVPVIAAHVLRAQRERERVSSTFLWRDAEEPVAPSRPWQRLRWSVPLALQLLLVALLALALARPAWTQTTSLAEHTVFVLDASGSMLADDGDPDRLEAAKERIDELLDELPDGGSASLVVASGDPELLVVDTSDGDAIRRELDRVRPTSGVADFDRAFTLAEALTSADRSTGYVLVSDGGVTEDEQRLAPPGTRFEPVGTGEVNRAVTALSVTVEDGGLAALVTMSNTGGPDATQDLRVDVDGATVARERVRLPAGETVEASVPIPPGSRVEAFLDGDDLLLIDNQRAALVPLAESLRVHVRSDDPDGSFFVDEVLAAMGAETVFAEADADLVIYDGVAVPSAPGRPFISIAGPGAPPGVLVVGEVERPIPTFVADDVVLRDVDVTSTAIAAAQRLVVEDGTILIGSAEGEPLLVEGRTGDVRWYHLAFDLEASNLPVEVAYPILFSRMVSDLTITDDVPASAAVGTRLPTVPFDAIVTAPRGVTTQVPAGTLMPVLDRSGFWTVEGADGAVRPVAVVFPSTESHLTVPDELAELPAAPADDGGTIGTTTSSERLVPWLLAVGVAVVVVELLLGLRHPGVPTWQRRAALAARVTVVLCLVGAVVGVRWTRSDDSVRAVLVIDVSDSLGEEGSRRVSSFVDAALDSADADDLAVVEVGRTVRVAKPFGRTAIDPEPPPGDGTDLARGLRLASSLLDGSTRERIVVVSDGLATDGTLASEADRLAEIGLRLDVVPVARPVGSDLAVTSIDAPTGVSRDEVYELTATVLAESDATTTVVLRRDDEPIETRTVDLVAGVNEVTFDVVAGNGGLERFSIAVEDGSDDIPQNDAAQVAVNVEGPPRVLVAEGDTDGGGLIEAALTARSIETERISVDELPSVDELTTFASVVLVDVDAADLAPRHVDALETHVREQGNGLVVIGGTSSFALGGYADTDLEDLLPIESRAEDPTRQATVAEVLLIDTSESMGSCHCAPVEGMGDDPFAGEPIEGGPNKTDISRTAAERAIAALSDNDEVGVLAFSGNHEWILPLQPVGEALAVAEEELGLLQPFGDTRIAPALDEAAAALRESNQELKHIILFSDGFSPELFNDGFFSEETGFASSGELEQQAAELADEGITVSVVATGEGAAPLLEAIALAGGGRFYPGRDLEEIPEIFVEEARIASRSFINEGEYLPVVTSTATPVRGLEAAPPVLGFLAATPKDTTDVMLQVGEFADPLLSSWRVGLGRVTAWTSDGGDRWAAEWASWNGWADFWSSVVRDTFPLEGADGHEVRAELRGGSLFLELVSETAWPSGSSPVAQVAAPDGTVTEIELERSSDTEFTAVVPATETGSYVVGVTGGAEDAGRIASTIASRSYAIEYQPSTGPPPDLPGLSERTGGRGEITADQLLDRDGLDAGSSARDLRWSLVLIAALLWPVAVILRRVRLRTLIDDVRSSRSPRRPASSSPRSTPTASEVVSAP